MLLKYASGEQDERSGSPRRRDENKLCVLFLAAITWLAILGTYAAHLRCGAIGQDGRMGGEGSGDGTPTFAARQTVHALSD